MLLRKITTFGTNAISRAPPRRRMLSTTTILNSPVSIRFLRGTDDRTQLWNVLWSAFSKKFPAVYNKVEDLGIAYNGPNALNEDRMMVATKEGTEQLLGYAALHYDNKGFSSLGLRDHINRRGLWKGFLGWVSLNIVASPTQPNEVMVSMLAVSPESRGLGVGTRLLSEVEKLALENKKHQLRLEVVSDNLDAQRLYERFGFQVTHTQSTYGLFSFPAVHTMVKKLDASQNDATKF